MQMVTTLMVGGCICVPSESDCRENIATAACQLGVNWALFTHSILRTVRHEDMPHLKHVVLVGETPARHDITAWPDHVHVISAYGSAECFVCCTVAQNMGPLSDPRLIGKMTGSVSWVVEPDNHHKLVPVGGVGELLVEGPILARGYLNDEEKTAEVFIEAPGWFSKFCERYNKTPRRGGRMYKTGDLVRYNADGSLTLIGRKDTQVKIRGQRVELSEVEYHVRQSLASNKGPPLVAEAVTPHGSDHPLLVIYLAIGEVANGSPDQVRAALERWTQGIEDRLRGQVPLYMIPSAYLAVDTMPMTATGKTNRRRLRELGGALTQGQLAEMQPFRRALRAPTTAMEKQLHILWASVLNLTPDRIGADDSFLQIGGDSITAVQLVAAAREAGLSLTVADIFNTPRLSDMAHMAKAEQYVEETIAPFSLLHIGTDVDVARTQAAAQCGVDADLVEDIFPCTPLQEGMLTMTAKRPGDYVSQVVLELRDNINIGQFKQAWEEVVATIPVLRTRIVDLADHGLAQVVVTAQSLFVASVANQSLRAYLETDKRQTMDLGTPLTRFAVVDDPRSLRPVFVWTIHHALFDAWSMPLVFRQVEQAYHGRTRDRLIPFQGSIKHMRQSGESTDAATEYWQSQLGGSEATPFPSLPRPGYQPRADDLVRHHISGVQWPQNNITASTVVRAAWAILVGQYTNTADVIFGATVSGRQEAVPGVERMAGPTIATVPVRVTWGWDDTLHGLLQRVQAQASSMTTHEQMGLQRIRRISSDTERGCQFQSLLVVQRSAQGSATDNTDGLFATPTDENIKVDEDAQRLTASNSYAILAECHLEEDGVTLNLSFDSQVTTKAQVQRMVWHLEHLVREVCASRAREIKIRDASGLSSEDRRQLELWNGQVPERVERCVHDLIAEQCQAQPDAPAVCAWDGDLTYNELNRLSSGLAAHLAGLGVGPEVFVPLLFEKSRWTTVAMVAVMKAGGAFVLLDPAHPVARRREICRAVSAELIVASAAQAATAGELAAQVVAVGDDTTTWTRTSLSWDGGSVVPDNALYAVFTSGSTGAPKGVVIPHSSFATSARAHGAAYGLTAESRMFQFSSYAFDAGITEILTTLSAGACVCVPADTTRRDDLTKAAGQLHVTSALLTPSTARLLQVGQLQMLRTLIFGGEAVTSRDIEMWINHVRVMNAYGPAECSVMATVQPDMASCDPNNIGHATGCVCWVVDRADHERLVPIGAVGELVIEGPIVGRGYLNNPAKTAAAFIDPPAWLRQFRTTYPGNPGGDRLYKTGDLVQYAADGSLRFIGRKDTQIKLRGQRIELGEVEHHIRQCFPGVYDVVAEVVSPGEAGRPVLVAFIHQSQTGLVGQEEDRPAARMLDREDILAAPTEAFRAAIAAAEAVLNDTVPSYMVPAVFLPLVRVPLTPTGKTDRRRLRERAAVLSHSELTAYYGTTTAKRAPATPGERTLQQLWAQTLNIPPDSIGADDSFFRLGGDSISAMQLSAHVRAAGFSLSVADIFHTKTIARLAPLLVTASRPLLDTHEAVEIPFDLTPIQRLFFDHNPHGANHFNQSFFLPVARPVAADTLARALHVIVRSHSMLRARFHQSDNGQWAQKVSAQVDRSYRYQSCQVASLAEARDIISASQQSLDFQHGPLLAADLIEIDGSTQYLSLVAHHLVIDLVSWRIILGDLEALLQTGELPTVPPLPFQTWGRLQGEYSRDHLAPAAALPSTTPAAPLDYWGPVGNANTHRDTLHGGFTLSTELTTALLGPANDALQTQPVEIFQAALWLSFVQSFPDRPPPTIFNEGHGREPWDPAIDLSRTVGWFTTIWPTSLEVEATGMTWSTSSVGRRMRAGGPPATDGRTSPRAF
ncbi:hypothetical protein AARAC_012045 [Aspergillus arachidicola]|uniref:Carrier domain-containing protein n=1 Tax=Aspergillus arachidicola TaxID=656916 RepID=A0A2G7EN74_9EURO|nr:hypothetical protein AARAC_012045 [Aspergillus arachidicola]